LWGRGEKKGGGGAKPADGQAADLMEWQAYGGVLAQ